MQKQLTSLMKIALYLCAKNKNGTAETVPFEIIS